LETQPADIVVVSASATESARLLLNSKSRLFPAGLGNRHDWVGRNLQGHGYSGAWGLFEDEVYDDVGAGATIGISDFNHGNPGLRGGGLLANEFIRLPYLFSRQRPPDAPRWGHEHKAFQRKYFRRSITVLGPVQEMPVFDCRIDVDPTVTDHWGIPVARLSGRRHPHDLEIGRFLASKAELWLKETGATRTWLRLPGTGVSGGQHQAGTCRMGQDPKTSVVNRYCQLHDVDNVFVVDGSVHVTNGGFNPALTIMAVAYWASKHIVSGWKGTGFKS
jgi:choline dehydrogenase-like flavoprotein